jgi:hypothetical protein
MCEIYKDFWLGCRAADRSDGRLGICPTHAEKLRTQRREKAERFNDESKERWNNGERRLRVTIVNVELARWRGKGAGCDIL